MLNKITYNPKLSVLVTAHGFEKYLKQCLDSVVSQKVNFCYEILCCDDCSPDSSPLILEDYQKRYPTLIKIIKNDKNLHYPKTNAKLISQAAGDYFIHIDGDDYLTNENKLQMQVDFLEKNKKFSGVGHNTMLVFEDGRKNEPMINLKIDEAHTALDIISGKIYFHTSSMMYRNIFKKNIPDFFTHPYAGDWLFMIVYAEHGYIGYIDELMSVYRIHKGGIWTSLGDLKQIERNIDFCPYYNKFLGYRYNLNFLLRTEMFIEHLRKNFATELKNNKKLNWKICRISLTCKVVKKLSDYGFKATWGTTLIKHQKHLKI